MAPQSLNYLDIKAAALLPAGQISRVTPTGRVLAAATNPSFGFRRLASRPASASTELAQRQTPRPATVAGGISTQNAGVIL